MSQVTARLQQVAVTVKLQSGQSRLHVSVAAADLLNRSTADQLDFRAN